MFKGKFHDYYAFVCHRSADKPLALAIQRKLERYSVPKKIIEENNYPTKHIRHICVDVTEFESNNLHSDIMDCLAKSDKLIVLCSKLSASPIEENTVWSNEGQIDWRKDPVSTGWIGFEILNFINMDRLSDGLEPFESIDQIRKYLDDNVEKLNNQEYRKAHPELNPFRNIIPVVKDGDPIQRTCFHPIIKLAIDRGLLKWYEAKDWNLKTEVSARKHGERGKFIDLILAVLSPVDAEEFRRRDKIRRQLQIAWASVSIVLAVAFIAFAIDYRMPHVSYYSDYVFENELPKGIDKAKLSNREVQQQTDCYKITKTKYNRTIKLEHINSVGTPIEDASANHMDAAMVAVYKCRRNWTPDVCEYLDRNGIVQMTYAYATDLKYVTFQENDFVSNQVYPVSKLNEYGIPDRMKIDRYGLVHDEKGKLIEKMYMSGVNYVYDDKGVAGEKYEYDAQGRLTHIHYVNRNGDYTNNQDGIHGLKINYDSKGNVSGYVFVNKDNEKIYCSDGYAEVKIDRDMKCVTITYMDTDEKPIINKDGYAVETQTLDKRMLAAETCYYDKDHNPAYCVDGYHKAAYAYNEYGDIIDISFFNANEKLIIGSEGYARKKFIRDENGNVLQETVFGSDNNEILLENKVCTIKRQYSEDGYLSDESYYGIQDKPIYTSEGYHGFTNQHDSKNRLIRTEYYGLDGKKSYTRQGYHKIAFEYDDRGNMTKISLYNASDRLVPYSGYWAEKRLSYNGGGQITRMEYLNQFEEPVNVVGGYATIESEYEDSGLLLQTAYYDSEGKLCDDFYINSVGVQVGTRYFAKVVFAYDDFGNVIHTDYYDTNDKPVRNYPFASKESAYDETRHKIQERYFDAAGNVPNAYFNYITYSYDDYGNILKAEYFGKNDVPLETRTTSGKNVHSIVVERDERGLVLSRTGYDKNKNQVEQVRFSYDDNGRELSEEYFGTDNKRINNEKGYSVIRYEYNALGHQTRKAYYDANEELCKVRTGYAICEQKYDDNGSLTDIYYYDEEERPVNLLAGYSHIHEDLNEYRNTVNCEFRDKNDSIILCYKVEYNDNAQIIKESLYGPDGNLYAHPGTGIAIRELDYDDMGNQISEKYYADNGKPILVYDEFSGWKSEYNEESLETRRTYYGIDGKPIMISEGLSSVSFTYDDYGREIERKFFDEKGNPVDTKFGFSTYRVQYDEAGKIQKVIFYDKNGTECNPDGEVKIVELNLHDGEVDTLAARYNPDSGNWETGALAKTIYNIYRIAYQSKEGKYDLMLQPYIPLFP